MQLEGKVAVVTGAAQGIGAEYARGLAEAGAAVTIADVNARGGEDVAAALRKDGHRALFIRTDVSEPDSTEEMARRTAEEFGGIDILVNNAMVFAGLPFESIEEMPVERFDRVWSVGVKGTWLATRAVLPYMRMRGGGSVVNQGSTAAYHNSPRRLHYNVTKQAIHGMTKSLAKELGKDGVRVNCIAPGAIDTEATLSGVPEDVLARAVAGQAMARQLHTGDLVGTLLFLVSDLSGPVTGQTLIADGGVCFVG
jgi:NAD(P)-dependent dehydrogenase (short-subunit alcohol dehydrogenase family)